MNLKSTPHPGPLPSEGEREDRSQLGICQKRILIIITLTSLSALILGLLRARESALLEVPVGLKARQAEFTSALAQEQVEQASLRQAIAAQQGQALLASQLPRLSPALTDWLLATNFSKLPHSLVAELRASLALPPNLSADCVLISKPSLQALQPRGPGRDDKLPDALCGILSLSPDQRQDIEAALSDSHAEFSDWAKQNLQRQGPQGDELVRYTIPPNDAANAITNRLMAKLSETLGDERTELFYQFADGWFEVQNGYLGTVTNTLSVLRKVDDHGQPRFLYHLTREGPQSSLGEGPNLIQPQFFPPAWLNVFPGGWAEVARREGFDLPAAAAGN